MGDLPSPLRAVGCVPAVLEGIEAFDDLSPALPVFEVPVHGVQRLRRKLLGRVEEEPVAFLLTKPQIQEAQQLPYLMLLVA